LTEPDPDRLYDRNFLLAMASQTCFVIANTLMAHYARWIEFLGGDLRQVGSIMGLGAFLGLLLRPWLAQWINRLGARTMWVVGYAVFAASSIANLMLIEIGPMIYILRSSLFVGTAIVFTSGLTYISQTAPDHRRVEAIGIFGIGGFLGMLIGPFLGDLFLYQRQWNNFAMLFVVAALANILPAIGLFFLRPTDSEGTNSSLRLREFVKVARRHWPGMILLVDLTFGVCMSGPFIFVASFVDGASLRTGGVSVIGLFFLCYAGMGISVRLSSRRLPDRIGPRKVLLVGMLFMAAGMLCFALVSAQHSWMIVIPALLGGVGHGLMFHTMTSLTLEAFPKEVRGTGSALALMMLDAGTLIGAPVLGLIGECFGFAALFGSIGALCLVTAAAYGATSRRVAVVAVIVLASLQQGVRVEAQTLSNWPQWRGPVDVIFQKLL
jgi:MFS family permease